jgi:hypothetical protein
MINLSELFGDTYKEYINEHKYTEHTSNSKYSTQDIFDAMFKFVNNSVYFSKFNDGINGKYLNKIHNNLTDHSFYDALYKKLLNIYVKVTDGKTLNSTHYDSTFIRNILCCEFNNRNPHYGNKPGLKMHIMCDELRTPISLVISESTDNDSLYVKPLFENLLIDSSDLQTHTSFVAADTGYEGFMNNHYVTEKGFDLYVGYNKRNNKNITTNKSCKDDLSMYKKRGIVENSFSNLQRYPVLLCNYEKTVNLTED